MPMIKSALPLPQLDQKFEVHVNLFEDELRGYKAIAQYRYVDPTKWRRITNLCKNGRFPFYRDGSTICARKSIIKRLIELQELYALLGKKWTARDVIEHFGTPEKPKHGAVTPNPANDSAAASGNSADGEPNTKD